jgi:hypothetical protein
MHSLTLFIQPLEIEEETSLAPTPELPQIHGHISKQLTELENV